MVANKSRRIAIEFQFLNLCVFKSDKLRLNPHYFSSELRIMFYKSAPFCKQRLLRHRLFRWNQRT